MFGSLVLVLNKNCAVIVTNSLLAGNSSGRERLIPGEGFEIVGTNKIAENVSKKRKKDASPPQHIQITENEKYNNAGADCYIYIVEFVSST